MIIIQPIGGLCNRMRAINSARVLASHKRDNLKIVWFCNAELNCPFEKLFVLPEDISLLTIHSSFHPIKLFYQFTSQFFNNESLLAKRKNGSLEDSFVPSLKKNCYIATEEHFYPDPDDSFFCPVPALQKRIDAITNQFSNPTIGVHIRRTDNLISQGKSTTDAFIHAMDAALLKNAATMFYLATDDKNEEKKLREIFSGHILTQENRELSRNKENGIQDALIDLFCLSKTDQIIGSYYSSFTDMAASMSHIPLLIAGEDTL